MNNRLVNATGLGDGWWSDFAVAAVCQSIGAVTGDATNYVDHGQVDQAVAANNTSLRSRLSSPYAYMLQTGFDDFKNPFNAMDHGAARTQYISVLTRSVQIHELWYSAGLWKNPDWELYHHWVKLTALGASVDDINRLIGQLAGAGLSIPASVQSGVWTQYSRFCRTGPISTMPISTTPAAASCARACGARGSASPRIEHARGVFLRFHRQQHAGSRFHKPSGGSCLSGNSGVLMADGSFRPVAQCAPATASRAPRDPAVSPLSANPYERPPALLLQGPGFSFTATHPFVHRRCRLRRAEACGGRLHRPRRRRSDLRPRRRRLWCRDPACSQTSGGVRSAASSATTTRCRTKSSTNSSPNPVDGSLRLPIGTPER